MFDQRTVVFVHDAGLCPEHELNEMCPTDWTVLAYMNNENCDARDLFLQQCRFECTVLVSHNCQTRKCRHMLEASCQVDLLGEKSS